MTCWWPEWTAPVLHTVWAWATPLPFCNSSSTHQLHYHWCYVAYGQLVNHYHFRGNSVVYYYCPRSNPYRFYSLRSITVDFPPFLRKLSWLPRYYCIPHYRIILYRVHILLKNIELSLCLNFLASAMQGQIFGLKFNPTLVGLDAIVLVLFSTLTPMRAVWGNLWYIGYYLRFQLCWHTVWLIQMTK